MFVPPVTRAFSKSCTVVINGVQECIRDGGIWYNCTTSGSADDFVRQICDAYTGTDLPAACL